MKRKKNRTMQQDTPTKMSEILLKYAWSYAIQDVEDPQLRQEFMNVACFAWNFSLLPEETNTTHQLATWQATPRTGRQEPATRITPASEIATQPSWVFPNSHPSVS